MASPEHNRSTPPPRQSSATDGEPPTLEAMLSELAAHPGGETRLSRAQARAVAWAQQATSHGRVARAAEVGWQTARRDASIAGSVLAAAIAYRIFIFLLPLSLLLVVAFGAYVDAAGIDAVDVLGDAGFTGYFAASVASASGGISGFARVAALLISAWLVLYEAYVLLRSLRATSALAWRMPISPLRAPLRPTLAFLGLLTATVLAAHSITPLQAQLGDVGTLLGVTAALCLVPVSWLVASWWLLPHRAERWRQLLPGALAFGIGFELLQLFYALILFPWLGEREETYGVLGVAAGLLFGFFLIGRLIELSASLNAVLYERRRD